MSNQNNDIPSFQQMQSVHETQLQKERDREARPILDGTKPMVEELHSIKISQKESGLIGKLTLIVLTLSLIVTIYVAFFK